MVKYQSTSQIEAARSNSTAYVDESNIQDYLSSM